MPRDGSGVYTLPAGNPVVTNTIIASTWANNTMSDIAAQLNNVFTRDGTLGPTGPFKIVDGTVAAPGLAWNSEPGLGWYRKAAGKIGLATQGGQILEYDGSAAGLSLITATPRANGTAQFRIFNQPAGTANFNYLTLSVNSDGSTGVISGAAGTATRGNLSLDATVISTTGSFNVAGNGEVQNGFFRILQQVNAGGAYATLQFATPNANRVMRFTNGALLQWVNSANTIVLAEMDDAGGLSMTKGYYGRAGWGGAAQTNAMNMFWNGTGVNLWVDTSPLGQINTTSDERVKKDIHPLGIARDSYMAIQPIRYRIADVGIFKDDGVEKWGFSAQQLIKAGMEKAVGGDVGALQENGDPAPANLDSVPILAQTVLMVQDLLNRVKQLEAA